MDMIRKLELAGQHIRSISRHDDEDAALRSAALDRIVAMVGAERAEMNARVEKRIAESLGKPKP